MLTIFWRCLGFCFTLIFHNLLQSAMLFMSFPLQRITCSAGDVESFPGSGRFPIEGNGNPLQYACLGIPWTEEPHGVQVHWVAKVRHDLVTIQQ